MKAVERFDPAKGGKLSTYGAWWIKQSIKRALANQSKTIRLPVHLVDKISKMRRTAMKLQEEFGREPTDEELGDELGMTAARVAQLRTAAIRPASLDAPIGDDDSNNFAEVVQDENAETPYEQLEDKTVTTHVAGDGKNARSPGSDHSSLSLRSRWREREDSGRSWTKIWSDPRACSTNSKYCSRQTSQDD